MSTTTAIERRPSGELATQDELTVDQMIGQVEKIQQAMSVLMKEGEHYGVIPGTEKPTLLKAGAEKLGLMFRLDPEYDIDERNDSDGHYHVRAVCTLFHIPTGNRVASGVGSCSSRETRYAYRTAARKCPDCQSEAIIKGKAEYGGGWVCFKKKGGCGAKFADDDARITQQPTGRVANENLADTYNTILKMAAKRARIDATLAATAASDIFTQDIEDLPVAGAAAVVEEQIEDAHVVEEYANVLVGSTVPSQFQSPPSAAKMISDAQVKKLWATWQQHKADRNDSVLQSLIEQVTGQTSTRGIPKEKFDAVLKAITSDDVPF